jgi:hypothetical protein
MKNKYTLFPFEYHYLRKMFHESCLYYGSTKDESLRLAAVVAYQMIPSAHRNDELRYLKSLCETALKNREGDELGETLIEFRGRIIHSIDLIDEIQKMSFGLFLGIDRKRRLWKVAPALMGAISTKNTDAFSKYVMEIRDNARR